MPTARQEKVIFNFPGLVSSFSKKPRNMSLVHGNPAASLENRKDFLSGLGINSRELVCAKQAHGSGVIYIAQEERGRGVFSEEAALQKIDAMVTDKKRVALAVFTADCLSVFLFDPLIQAIGLIHAGWRGSRENIAAKTVELMRSRCGTKPENLYAGFGPAIRQCCYEVGGEFREYFPRGLISRKGRVYLDLAGINKQQLLESGVAREKIFDCGICTSCRNREYFSFRREGNNCGRIMSVIMLK